MIKAFIFFATTLLFGVVNACDCDTVYKGNYTWGAEVDVFQPCGSKKVYWVSASSWVKRPLIEYVKNTTTRAYQSVYIEFRGHILNEVRYGFAEQYDGLIRVSEISYQSRKESVECSG